MKTKNLYCSLLLCTAMNSSIVNAKWNLKSTTNALKDATEALRGIGNLGTSGIPVNFDVKDLGEKVVHELKENITLRNAFELGAPVAAGLAVSAAGWYGSRLLWNTLEKKVLNPKPAIIEPEAHPKYGRIDRFRRWLAGYQTPKVIFDEKAKEHLDEILAKTKNINDHIRNGGKDTNYTNLLLYGPPGTGKTLFARILADYTDMDFLPLSGARLLQEELAFSEVVDMANRSAYGAIIFIDEADSLFMNRDLLMASTAPDALSQYKALTHILGITGQNNNKYMIIAATNKPHVLDEAMDRRFPDTIEMPLPTTKTRLALLNLYINNNIFNEKNNTKEFITAARTLLIPTAIQEIADKTEGFSHSKLENLIVAIRDSARSIPSELITQKGIENAISRALENYKKFTKDKVTPISTPVR